MNIFSTISDGLPIAINLDDVVFVNVLPTQDDTEHFRYGIHIGFKQNERSDIQLFYETIAHRHSAYQDLVRQLKGTDNGQ